MINAIVSSDAKQNSDIAALQTTDVALITMIDMIVSSDAKQNSDIAALQATDTAIIIRLDNLTASDAALVTMINAMISSDAKQTSDIAALQSTDTAIIARIDAMTSSTGATGGEIATYSGSTAYSSGDKVWYKGIVWQSTTTQTGVAPPTLLFHDTFTGYCDGVMTTSALLGYGNNTNGLGNVFSSAGMVVTSSGSTVYIEKAAGESRFVTVQPMDPTSPGTVQVDAVIDVVMKACPDNVYIGMPLNDANGYLAWTFGFGTTASPTLNTFAISSNNGACQAVGNTPLNLGQLTLTADAGTYLAPTTGDTIRITRASTSFCWQIMHTSVWGPLMQFTWSGPATASTTSADISFGVGGANTYQISSFRVYPSAPGSTWTEVLQETSRAIVSSNTVTLHARYGRIFVNMSSITANSTYAPFIWYNSHITPEAHIKLQMTTLGNGSLSNAGIVPMIIGQGWGRANIMLINGGLNTTGAQKITLAFRIDYPISLTGLTS